MRRRSAKGLWWRGVVVAALGALLWIPWSRRGPVVGVPGAIGFAFAAFRLFAASSATWASRHRVWNEVGVWTFVGALWVCLYAITAPQAPTSGLFGGAVTWIVMCRASEWWTNHRKARAARRGLLAALATDLQSVVQARRALERRALALQAAGREAGDDVALEDQEQDDRRDGGDGGRGQQHVLRDPLTQ